MFLTSRLLMFLLSPQSELHIYVHFPVIAVQIA